MPHHTKVQISLFTLIMAVSPCSLRASDSIWVNATVLDAMTRKELVGVRITAMRMDSTVVSSRLSFVFGNSQNIRSAKPEIICSTKVPTAGTYLVKLEKEGYASAVRRAEIPRRERGTRTTFWSVGTVMLLPQSIQLGEATVKASKILMVMRGDTLVYNADALNLAAGSMLERLIEQLPGVQLDDAGQITVNGSRVDKLLLNGKDFFRGDPLVALENLPAYMVDEVKVYQQEAPDAYLRPGRDEDEPQSSGGWEDGSYVMDVWLKREYAAGWIGNAEGAYGTDRRYQARALALRFSDRSRTSLYFNLNNTKTRGGRDAAETGRRPGPPRG